jgi:hypothetical protein
MEKQDKKLNKMCSMDNLNLKVFPTKMITILDDVWGPISKECKDLIT